jgi:hypothetical protein
MSRFLLSAMIGLALVVSACGDERSGSEPQNGDREAARPSVSDAAGTPNVPPGVPHRSGDGSADVLEGRRPVPTEGGGVYYAPIKPRLELVEPSRTCVRGSDESHPPRPGLEVVRSGDRQFRVRVVLAPVPGECAPKFIRMAFDVNDDPLPPASPLAGPLIPAKRFTPWLEVTVPDRVKEADVLSAISVTADGRSGDAASVLIGSGR